MSSMTRRTSAGGTASDTPGKRRKVRRRMARSSASGSCTPAMPRPFHRMPQQPIGVSNSAKPNSVITSLFKSVMSPQIGCGPATSTRFQQITEQNRFQG
jgi:hypothetical protein